MTDSALTWMMNDTYCIVAMAVVVISGCIALAVDRQRMKCTLELLKEQESIVEALKSDLDETLAVLGELPEIVRCKDCKYAELVCDGCYACNCIEHDLSSAVNPDWFCADGERKSDG